MTSRAVVIESPAVTVVEVEVAALPHQLKSSSRVPGVLTMIPVASVNCNWQPAFEGHAE